MVSIVCMPPFNQFPGRQIFLGELLTEKDLKFYGEPMCFGSFFEHFGLKPG